MNSGGTPAFWAARAKASWFVPPGGRPGQGPATGVGAAQHAPAEPGGSPLPGQRHLYPTERSMLARDESPRLSAWPARSEMKSRSESVRCPRCRAAVRQGAQAPWPGLGLRARPERLTAAGVRFHCAPIDVGHAKVTTYARDPERNVIELTNVDGTEWVA